MFLRERTFLIGVGLALAGVAPMPHRGAPGRAGGLREMIISALRDDEVAFAKLK